MKTDKSKKALQIRVELEGTWPPVWRRILIPDTITLLKLHGVIQEVFGWEDYHLHQYSIRGVEYGDPDNDEIGDLDIHDETEISLRELGLAPQESFTYTYDFGDNWTHTLRLERILNVEGKKRLPRCLAGERACPPEDVGGIGGYAQFLAHLKVTNDVSAAEETHQLSLLENQNLVDVVLCDESHGRVQVIFWGYTVKRLASHDLFRWCLSPFILG